MAAQEGIVVGEQLTLLRRNLVHTLVRNEDLLLELGEHQAELVDALGIFEYFNDTDAVIFLQRAAAGQARRRGDCVEHADQQPAD
jgi:hypothetical protein